MEAAKFGLQSKHETRKKCANNGRVEIRGKKAVVGDGHKGKM